MKELHPLLKTHSANPLPVHLHDDVFRVFFSSRDDDNKSSVGYTDIDIVKNEVLETCSQPLISYGDADCFFSHGISIGNVYVQNEKNFILFMGWNIPENQHWRGDVGRIELKQNNTMVLNPPEAFMTIDNEDKVSLSYPFVAFHEGIYKMWYGSTVNWQESNNEMLHVIKYAISRDGTNWDKKGIAIPYELGVAQAFSRPTLIIDETGYHMWYSFRSGDGTKYRIGYSTSADGIKWERKHNETGIKVSSEGWDSEMICYPFVFKHKGKMYMLYNGNDYGKHGFGLAVSE